VLCVCVCVWCVILVSLFVFFSCTQCTPGSITLGPASDCVELVDASGGLVAPTGFLQVESGWWAWVENQQNVKGERFGESQGGLPLYAAQCPPNHCMGTVLQSMNSTSLHVAHLHQCTYPRVDSNDNFLCGRCIDGYIEWNGECADCRHVTNGYLFLAFLLLFAIVLFLQAVTGPSKLPSGLLTVALYFGQTALIEVGSLSNLLGWLHLLNFDVQSLGTCLARWDAYQQTMASLAVPFIMLIQLLFIASIQRFAGLISTLCCGRLASLLMTWHSRFSIGHYLATTVQVMLFTFNRTVLTCINYLHCVPVAGESVVFAWPTMDCRSDTYTKYLPIVILALVISVAGVIVLLTWLLWRGHAKVFQLLQKDAQQIQLESNQSNTAASIKLNQNELHSLNEEEDSLSISSPPLSPLLSPQSSTSVTLPMSDSVLDSTTVDSSIRTSLLIPLLSSYTADSWLFPVVQLIRRLVFVLLSVLLSRGSVQALAYTYLHFASLLLHLLVQPFSAPLLNRAEFVSLSALVCLSTLLVAYQPPYSAGFESLLFVFVAPLFIGFIGLVVITAILSSGLHGTATLSSMRRLWNNARQKRNENKSDHTAPSIIPSTKHVRKSSISRSQQRIGSTALNDADNEEYMTRRMSMEDISSDPKVSSLPVATSQRGSSYHAPNSLTQRLL
jgi:hypothetical protein